MTLNEEREQLMEQTIKRKKEPINEHGERRIKTRLGKPINAIG
jgi:hypothetical protein